MAALSLPINKRGSTVLTVTLMVWLLVPRYPVSECTLILGHLQKIIQVLSSKQILEGTLIVIETFSTCVTVVLENFCLIFNILHNNTRSLRQPMTTTDDHRACVCM